MSKKFDEDKDKLDCVVEVWGEVRRIQVIRRNRQPEDEEQPYTVYLDNDIDDGVGDIAEILDRYGEFYWDDIDDFVANYKNGKSLRDWMKP